MPHGTHTSRLFSGRSEQQVIFWVYLQVWIPPCLWKRFSLCVIMLRTTCHSPTRLVPLPIYSQNLDIPFWAPTNDLHPQPQFQGIAAPHARFPLQLTRGWAAHSSSAHPQWCPANSTATLQDDGDRKGSESCRHCYLILKGVPITLKELLFVGRGFYLSFNHKTS